MQRSYHTLSREIHLWYIGTTNAQTSLRTTGLIGTFVSRKCNQKYRQSFKQFGSFVTDLGPHCLQTKKYRQCPPPIPWRKSLEVHMNGTHGSRQGVQVHWQLLYFCLTTHRHISSYEDWTTALSLIQWTGDAKESSGVF